MNVTSPHSEQQLYSVMKELLPQLQKQLKQDLQVKYNKAFNERQAELKRHLQSVYNQKMEIVLARKEEEMAGQFERMNREKIKKQDKTRYEHERQFGQMRERILRLEKENQVLISQKMNWTKLEKGYQKTIKDLANQYSTSNNLPPETSQSVTKNQPKFFQGLRQSFSIGLQKMVKPVHQLSIETKDFKEIQSKQYPMMESSSESRNYYTDQTQQTPSEVQGILSPPSIDPHLIDSVLEMSSQVKPNKKQMHWNQQKKQQLLKMIRQKMR